MASAARQRLLTALLGAAAAIGASALIPATAAAQDYPPPPYDQGQYPPQGGQYAPGQYPPQGPYDQGQYGQGAYDQSQDGAPVTAGFAPPPLPDYDQPPPPGPDFLWQPGYWAWDDYDGDYYWVPGAWVEAPEPGLLWTPAWWGWDNGAFLFHQGYWGAQIGWYGGIAYGFGYNGRGYEGGYWQGRHFFYNRAANNLGAGHFANVYSRPVTVASPSMRSSFNGPGGFQGRPTTQDLAVQNQRRYAPTAAQVQNARGAMSQPQFRASRNNGAPPVAAVAQPGQFQGPGVVGARSAGPGFKAFTPPPRNNTGAPPRYAPPAGAPAYQPPRNNVPAYQPPRNNAPAYRPPQNNAPAYQQPRYTPPAQTPPRPAAPQGYSPAPHYAPPPPPPHPPAPPKPPKSDEQHPPA